MGAQLPEQGSWASCRQSTRSEPASVSALGCLGSGLPTGGLDRERPGGAEHLEHLGHPEHPVHPGDHQDQAGTDKGSMGRGPWAGIPVPGGTNPGARTACRRTEPGPDPGQGQDHRRGPSLPCAGDSNRTPVGQAGDLAGSEDPGGRRDPGAPGALEDRQDRGGREGHFRAEREP
jgi:hypothetical protein